MGGTDLSGATEAIKLALIAGLEGRLVNLVVGFELTGIQVQIGNADLLLGLKLLWISIVIGADLLFCGLSVGHSAVAVDNAVKAAALLFPECQGLAVFSRNLQRRITDARD